MGKLVLIIGGYGVFGGRLAQALLREPRLDVVVAGRDVEKAKAFCALHGGRAIALDSGAKNLTEEIFRQAPFIVIDAAGPFQGYRDSPYRIAKAALACGAHYLDLSDDAGFTTGIRQLDAAAVQAGVVLLSGVSSVPALSSAAVAGLASEMREIKLIESVILPGNRAPRGLSVMRAILAQVGRPLRVWRDGEFQTVTGWSEERCEVLRVENVAPVTGRRSSLIGAPDLVLFAEFFGARTVEFRAGLDLWIMHRGLAVVGKIVQFKWLKSAEPLARILKWAADRLEPFGSDRGGMRVRVVGTLADGRIACGEWSLIAEAGDGPHIPAVPARVMCKRLLEGKTKAGARPCLAEFTLAEAEAEMADLDVVYSRTACHT